MAFKDPARDGGYPFPPNKLPSASRYIEQQTARAQEQIRDEKLPPKMAALGKEAIVREKQLGDVKELNYTQKPRPRKSGNNSSF